MVRLVGALLLIGALSACASTGVYYAPLQGQTTAQLEADYHDCKAAADAAPCMESRGYQTVRPAKESGWDTAAGILGVLSSLFLAVP